MNGIGLISPSSAAATAAETEMVPTNHVSRILPTQKSVTAQLQSTRVEQKFYAQGSAAFRGIPRRPQRERIPAVARARSPHRIQSRGDSGRGPRSAHDLQLYAPAETRYGGVKQSR